MLCGNVMPVSAQKMAAMDTDSVLTIVRPKYQKRLITAKEHWMRLIPNLSLVQYAGNIGFFSVGTGWDYGKHDRWETHLMLGFLPKAVMADPMVTMTLRESLNPWHVCINDHFTWNPATFSLSFNTVFNNEFWYSETERYEGDYYRFSSKLRAQIGIGGRINLHFTDYKRMDTDRLSFYYELSTYDLAIISYVPNHRMKFWNIVALGFGIEYKFF